MKFAEMDQNRILTKQML